MTTRKTQFLLRDLPRCAYLGTYYVANGPFALSSARAITEVVFRLSRARAEQEFARFVATEHGRRLLAEGSELAAKLDDHASLASMPDGSLGRAYLEFMQGMLGADEEVMAEAGGFLSLLRIDEVGKELGYPAELIWFLRRLTMTHDLTHLFTGYGTDNAGEFANIAYTTGHFQIKALIPIALGLSLVARPEDHGRTQWWRYLWTAYTRGKNQRESLIQLDYESLLPLQVEEVQRLIGIEDFAAAHPGGPIIDELGFNNLNKQAIMSH
jgi:ubiquinone biosynthesis protein COQ4